MTKEGPKPELHVVLSCEEGKKVIELVKSDLEDGVRRLRSDPRLRRRLLAKALEYLDQVEISVQGADKEMEEGRRIIEEVRQKIRERVKRFLDELRLGEGGKVCLAGCQFSEYTLSYKHEPYARVVAPLIHYIAEDAPREEVMKFLAELILYDGNVSPERVLLTMGNFHFEEQSNALPLDVYDKLALFITFAAKYDVGMKNIYIKLSAEKANAVKKFIEVMIYFDKWYAAEMFAQAWASLDADWKFGREHELYDDHLFNKLQKARGYIEDYANNVKIEHVVRRDKATVYFKNENGSEIAHINIGWDGHSLLAKFKGARERAERLAAILNALGADVEVREDVSMWSVRLYTDAITAIRRPEWLEAVRALVKELYKNRKITKEQRDRLLGKIAAGPNVVEIACVGMSITLDEKEVKTSKYRSLKIIYQPSSPEAFDAAVKALKEAGFEDGIHFTAKRPEGEERGYIHLRTQAGLWKLVELSRKDVMWAKRALDKLEEIARARGFYDLLEEYLKPAKMAGMVDPQGMIAVDDERGIKAVIKDVKLQWEEERPRVIVEYDSNTSNKSFHFIWDVREGVTAAIWLDYEKAAVLATLTGDGSLKGKKGVVTLSAKHLFALAQYRGTGWDLLWWYVKVTSKK